MGKIILIVLTLTGLGFVARYNLRDNLVPRNAGTVVAGKIYRSGRLTPAATQKLAEQHGLKTIIDLGAYRDDPLQERIAARTAAALHLKRYVFHLEGDGTGDPQEYVAALRLLVDPQNQPVLVHCAAGSERTSACVMLYRRIFEGKPFDETYQAEALQFKHVPRRNPLFRPYLDQWGEAIEKAVRSGTDIGATP